MYIVHSFCKLKHSSDKITGVYDFVTLNHIMGLGPGNNLVPALLCSHPYYNVV